MAIRKCGKVKINCLYRDASDDYRCALSVGGARRGVVYVGTPRHLTHAVDSEKAYSDTAKAAISFALDEGKISDGELEYGDSGPRLQRPKRRG